MGIEWNDTIKFLFFNSVNSHFISYYLAKDNDLTNSMSRIKFKVWIIFLYDFDFIYNHEITKSKSNTTICYAPTVVKFPLQFMARNILSYGKIGKHTLKARTNVSNYNLKHITVGVYSVVPIYSIFPNLTRQK